MENILLEVQNIRCSSSQLRSAASAVTITTKRETVFKENMHEDTNQTSGHSAKAKNVKSNSDDDVCLALAVVPQIGTALG
jgi:hypothetical protein